MQITITQLAGTKFAVVEDGKATFIGSLDDANEFLYGPMEGPTCSICDGLGHGYPGAGPCPLEERGWEDAIQDEREGCF